MLTYLNREWHWFDYSIVFLRLLWYFMNLVIILTTDSLDENPYMLVFLFTISYLVPQLFHLPNRISSMGFILSELLLTGSLFLWIASFSENVIDFIWILILSIAFLSTKRTQWWGIIGIVVLPLGTFLLDSLTQQFLFSYVIALVLFGTVGMAFRFLLEKNEEQKLLLEQLNVKNQQLVQLSSEIEYLTIKEERNRIAQELHDAVGHTFTTTIVGLDAIVSLVERQPAAAKEQAVLLADYTREALEEMRKYVHALPIKEEVSIVFAFEKVITSFTEATGMDVSFEAEGDESQVLPKQYTIFFIRCLQEALTNALKHGHATKILVKLLHNEKEMKLLVKDNGVGKEDLTLGFGLSAMKQRIEELGGSFFISSTKQGTAIELEAALKGGASYD